MLLHRTKPNTKLFILNKFIQSISKPVNNNLAVINYEKEDENGDINIIENDENNYDNNYEIYDEIYDVSIEENDLMTRSMARNIFIQWKPLNNPGIFSIVFYIDSSNNAVPVYKYSNAYAFLPISNNLIYAASIFMETNIAYSQGNIFSVTKGDVFNDDFQFDLKTRGVVGQGVDPPNNAVGLGINNNSNKIYAIARDPSNNIYIGGSFYINDGTLNGIKGFAKWDIIQEKWSSVGDGITFNLQSGGAVYSIVVINQNNIYVGGYFSYLDENNPQGSQASSFARWNGVNWERNLLSLTDIGGNPASVYAMKRDGNNLYIGGLIRNAKTSTSSTLRVNNILRFNINTITFSALIGGVNGPVYAMDIKPNRALYIGGAFLSVNTAGRDPPTRSLQVNNIARWNIATEIISGRTYLANTWSVIQYSTNPNITDPTVRPSQRPNGNRGVPNTVYAIAANPNNRNIIYIGGIFVTTTGTNRTLSRASNYISYFNITRNFTTSLWAVVKYGAPPTF